MNSKIPVKQFAEKIAAESGVSQDVAQQFVKLYFDEVVARLKVGEIIDISGLGKFSLTHNMQEPVVFTPDADAAAVVNAPFEMFEPTELPAGVSEQDLAAEPVEAETELLAEAEPNITDTTNWTNESNELPEPDEEPEHEPEVEVVQEIVAEPETEPELKVEQDIVAEPETEPELEPEPEPETEPELVPEPEPETEPVPEPEAAAEEDEYIPEDEEEYVQIVPRNKGLSFGMGFLVGLLSGLIIGAVALFVYAMYYVNTSVVAQ